MGRLIDLTGQRFGRLTVVSRAENDKNKTPRWRCLCDCGKETVVLGHLLRNGNTRSCGCFGREQKSALMKKYCLEHKVRSPAHVTHNASKTRLYAIWCGMKGRCYGVKNSVYQYYGGRGIIVCNEWLHSFMAFRDWALSHGYQDDLTIDRIDVNGNYEPSNCRWLTLEDQQRNRRPRKRKKEEKA